MDALSRYRAAEARLNALIAAPPADQTPAGIRARAEYRLRRVKRFLAHLGNPQDRYPVVHVGGTSGKGSTSIAVAAILTAAGHRVGLHTSPYLQVATEKLQLDGRLIAAAAFADLVADVLAAAVAWSAREGEEALTYGEVWIALAARWCAQERVDLAVIEVGAGGRFDLTNVVRPAVSVVTTVGLDHTATLGATIPEIAWHKAGIVKAGAPAVTAVLDAAALGPIAAEAAAVGTTLTRVIPGETFEVLAADPSGTRWRELRPDRSPGPTLTTPLRGRFQAANAAVALAAVRALASRGFIPGDDAVRAGLASALLPGRFEAMPEQTAPRVILDGAHNPQKVAALVADLPALLNPKPGDRLVLLVAALEGKAATDMLRHLAPHAAALVVTAAPVLGKSATPAADLAATARAAGFLGPILIEPDPKVALSTAVAVAAGPRDTLLVTGSLYLVGHARARWYPDDAVVLQRTPWPKPT